MRVRSWGTLRTGNGDEKAGQLKTVIGMKRVFIRGNSSCLAMNGALMYRPVYPLVCFLSATHLDREFCYSVSSQKIRAGCESNVFSGSIRKELLLIHEQQLFQHSSQSYIMDRSCL